MADLKEVLVGCKLPHGIILEVPHPDGEIETVELNGLNKVLIVGSTFGATEVDAAFWEAWILKNAESDLVKSGSVFVAKDLRSLKAIGDENAKRETGFEPLDPNKLPKGLKSLDNKDD